MMQHAKTTRKHRQNNASTLATTHQNGSGRRSPASADPGRDALHDVVGPPHRLGPAVQTKLTVGPVDDPFEREADTVAERVAAGRTAPPISRLGPAGVAQRQTEEEPVRRQIAEEPIQRQAEDEPVQRQAVAEEPVQRQAVDEEPVQRQAADEEPVQRQPLEGEPVQRKGLGAPRVSARTASTIRNPGPGRPIPAGVRHRIEPQVGADLSHVRVHTGSGPGRAATNLNAHAFTHHHHIFLNGGASPHDVRLMAHEATHVVQQGAARGGPRPGRYAPPDVQRLPGFIMEELNSYARHIPGYTLFTVIIGYNPLLGERVERNAMNLLEGLMGIVPFGTAIFDKLREYGIIQDAFTWVEGQLSRLDLSLARIERTIEAAWEDVRIVEGWDYNLNVLQRHFGRLYDDVVSFAASLVNQIIALIKEAAIGVAEGLLAENRAWELIKKILHYDPLRDEPVEATTVEILEEFLLLIGKETELEQMRERGTLQETADWLDTQMAAFLGLLAQLRSLITSAWDAIQPENLPNLATNLQTLATQAFSFLQQVWDFAATVALQVLELIKNALLSWLSEFAHEVPGFHLITVILGRNPFTQEPVPRTAENIIRGFITLLPGGNAAYDQLAETGVIGQAAARIEGAMSDLGISWESIVGIFTGIWNSLSINDLVDPIGAFTRIRDQFGEPIARLFTFIGVVIEEVFKLILQLMNFPTDILSSIITNAMQAIEDIKRDPIGFFKNMLAAVKLGFSNFFDNILTHLLGGLSDWLFRGLRGAGIEPPTDLSLQSILNFVLDVLGISMDRIWEKLAERFGQETVDRIRGAIDRLVGIWNFVRDVQERGVAAIWEYIESQISGLWDMVLEQAKNWIMERIINRAIQWLLSLLDPTGIMPVINSFIAFFRAVQSAIEYIRDILMIVNDYVTTIAAVARGEIQPGADKMEQGLANAIPIAIGFLANQFGLGNIAEKIQEIVGGIRSLVDRALDWLLDQAQRALQGLMRMLGFGGGDAEGEPAAGAEGNMWWELNAPFEQVGEGHHLLFEGEEDNSDLMVQSTRMPLQTWIAQARAELAAHQGDMNDNEYAQNENLLNLIELRAGEVRQEKQRFATLFETEQRRGVEVRADSIGVQSGEEIRRLFLSILDMMKGLTFRGANDARPPSRILVQQTQGVSLTGDQVGKVIVAQPLSLNPGELRGSRPGGDRSTLFTRVKTDRPGTYVQAHLLNDNLHGAGEPQNLAPLPGQDNTLMSSRIEEPVKDAVLGENKVVSYRMQFRYGGHSASNLTPAEKELPTSLEGQAYGMKLKANVPATEEASENPDNWEVDRSDVIVPATPLEVRMPTTSVGTVSLRRLSLSDDFSSAETSAGTPIPQADARAAAIAALSLVPGIAHTLAERIINARPNSVSELENVDGIGPERKNAVISSGIGIDIVFTGTSEWQ